MVVSCETCIINLSATRTRPLKETKYWLGLSEITELIGQDNERESKENTRLLSNFNYFHMRLIYAKR